MSQPSGGESGAIHAPQLLHEFFERALARFPDRVAVEIPPGHERVSRSITTYAELDRSARSIAAAISVAVAGECVVAILLPRTSPALFAAQLAVLRTGAAYACIDPAFPDAHAASILADARPVALITDAAGVARSARIATPSLCVLDVAQCTAAPPTTSDAARPAWLRASSLAYVIYTSGTTGRPKGVMIEHGAIANLIASDVEQFALQPTERVAQGSSSAYDSSVEEIWLAWSAGATVVVMDDDTARAGPDLVAWLRTERISVLCPTPTLLRSTGCAEPHAELPQLKLVYAGGEALPRDIADRWSSGIRFENGYGPTECTVTVMRAPVRVGEEITIGKAVRGSRAHVLDEDAHEVVGGQAGELCISGLSLARGYLGKPELTEQRFPTHPVFGRIYRTGDLVRRDEHGDHHYLGRIDAQVKLRGYRVELGAIEAVIAAQAGVRAAVCRVQSAGTAQILVAHVVPTSPEHVPDFALLRDAVRAELPEYMVPARFAVAQQIPVLASGKLDREALPDVQGSASRDAAFEPRDELEARIVAAFQSVLGAHERPAPDADFFLDLGGDSLRAAEAISVLRAEPSTAGLTVRDLYELRTGAGLAGRVRNTPAFDYEPNRKERLGRRNPALATLVHCAWLSAALILSSTAFYLIGFEVLAALVRRLDLVLFALVSPLLALIATAGYTLLAVLATLAAKRILIGRYSATRAPIWSSLHVRNWIVQQVAASVPWTLLQDTVFLNSVLRVLGARVGRRVHIHRGVDLRQGGWDLLEIGDDATLAQESAVRLVQVEHNEVVFGAVKLGARSLLDVRASVGPDGALGDDAILEPLAWLPPTSRVPHGESWSGVPASRASVTPPLPKVSDGAELSTFAHGLATFGARSLRISAAVWIPLIALAVLSVVVADLDADAVLAFLFESDASLRGLALALLLTVASAPLAVLAGALVCRALGRVKPGVISRWSFGYLRVLAKTDMVQAAGNLLSGTLFWPLWLRLAGMRVGQGCEISTIIDVVPELIEVGDESFFADGIYLGSPRVRAGTVTLAETRLATNTFLGNHCVVPAGTHLPADVLIGVSTVADTAQARPGTSWFGLPPIELPRRPPDDVDRRLTHEPGFVRYTNRLVWESARILLPIVPLVVALAWLRVTAVAEAEYTSAAFHFLVLPSITFLAGCALILAVLALKWSLLGRVRPGEHGLWSCWCSRWDFLFMAWGQWARPVLARFEGTQILAWYLRAMGARIGRRVLLEAGFAHVVDPDMLRFEDDATVSCLFQAHSFEDRVLKIDHVDIRRGAWVGQGTVVFYGADIGAESRVAPHGVVMKHEHLPAGGAYVGSPLARGDGSVQASF
ncbi:MAG: amino acid adenylation domain-containing protein [Planctomycetes bacterium]|nr:amino acid adenylation domain-containing protein [Planctomycetota bacterium]